MQNGFDPGMVVVVTETLGPGQATPTVLKRRVKPPALVAKQAVSSPLGPPPPTAVRARVYLAVGINHHGQKGAVSTRLVVPLLAPGAAPVAPQVTYGEHSLSVTWSAPPGLRQPTLAPSGPDVLAARAIGMSTAPSAYNVYEVPPPSTGASPAPTIAPPPGGQMPSPLNEKPLAEPPFEDKRLEFGKPRCYEVRLVDQLPGVAVESAPSPPACASPIRYLPALAAQVPRGRWERGRHQLDSGSEHQRGPRRLPRATR